MSWILAFVGFAALIILHELGHFWAAKKVGMRVERFSLFFPPLVWRSKKRGETEYAIGAIPLGGYVKITGMNPNEEIPPEVAHRAYFRQPVWKRIVVIAAGPAVNILIAFLILATIFVIGGGPAEPTRKIGTPEQGLPAAGVLERGDEILSIDGKPFREGDVENQIQAFSRQISSHKCAGTPVKGCKATTPVVMHVLRNGRPKTLRITPVYDAKPELKRTRLGFTFLAERPEVGPLHASSLALSQMWTFTSATVSTLARLFDAEKRKELSGVVGSYEVTRRSISIDAERAFYILAVISLSLGVINLFPFLPLDGGHIFWALAEKVRRRPIPFATMEKAGFVGFALVLMLFIIGLTNDIDRLANGGFDLQR